jgi:hypothetical protein
VNTDNISVLHSAEIAHLYPQVVIPICHVVMIHIHLYRGSEIVRQSSITRPFQSFTREENPLAI